MTLLEQQSLANPEVLENPDAYHHALHEQPIFLDEQLGFYICSTYKLMREIMRNTSVFSSVESQRVDAMRPPPPEVIALRAEMQPGVNTLVTNDPPSHTRVRAMVNEPFRPRNIEKLIGQIQAIVNESIDSFIDDGAFEAVSQLAIPVPIKVIADMLGVERNMAPKIKAWSDASVEPLGMMISDERLIECTRLVKEFQDFMAGELEARRDDPRDDLLTELVQARDPDGNAFSMAEMLSLTSQFLVAGNETTTNGIAAGVELLVNNPDQQEILRREPSRVRVFINEVLRLEAPVQGLFRVVTADTELNGVKIPKGSRIMLRFAAANRDASKFHDPDALDVTRHNAGSNVAFGAGIHHCIGANLAREEMVQTFDLLLKRTANLAFAEGRNDFTHHPSMILRGLKHLHLTFDSLDGAVR
ncbi:MAG: cytochrome P450 [Gammaproteobacteria bacterium]|nr:cytochrome P450 [Gammaproteobacteria bacterium]